MGLTMRFPNGKEKALTMSYDDGVGCDIRLMELFKEHGIKATFNINSELFGKEEKTNDERMSLEQIKKVYDPEYFEVAIHGAQHPHWEYLPHVACVRDIFEDRKNLETIFGRIIRGAAYPYGTYNDEVVEILRLCEIAYCRTTKSTQNFTIPENWLLLNPTCHHSDAKMEELMDKFLNGKPRRRKDPPQLFYIWGHSYEFDRNNNWETIEHICERLGGHEDIWYATNIEIYDYCMAYRALQCNASETMVHNPSAIDVWISNNNGAICVPAGETVVIA